MVHGSCISLWIEDNRLIGRYIENDKENCIALGWLLEIMLINIRGSKEVKNERKGGARRKVVSIGNKYWRLKGKKQLMYAPSLELKMTINSIKNMEYVKAFKKSNIVCLATTNTYYSRRTKAVDSTIAYGAEAYLNTPLSLNSGNLSPMSPSDNHNTHIDALGHLNSDEIKFHETLKLKLPKKLTSKWLRVIIYDVLPSNIPFSYISQQTDASVTSSNNSSIAINHNHNNNNNHNNNHNHNHNQNNNSNSLTLVTSDDNISINSVYSDSPREVMRVDSYSNSIRNINSSTERNASTLSLTSTNSNDNSSPHPLDYKKISSREKYLYLGEVKVSLLDLFKTKDKKNSYNFQKSVESYKIYDKRRQILLKGTNRLKDNKSTFQVGDIDMSFKLKSISKKQDTFEAYSELYNNITSSLNLKLEKKNKLKLLQAKRKASSAAKSTLIDMPSSSISESNINRASSNNELTDSQIINNRTGGSNNATMENTILSEVITNLNSIGESKISRNANKVSIEDDENEIAYDGINGDDDEIIYEYDIDDMDDLEDIEFANDVDDLDEIADLESFISETKSEESLIPFEGVFDQNTIRDTIISDKYDLGSMVTALDEYDIVDKKDVADINEIINDLDEELEDEVEIVTDDFRLNQESYDGENEEKYDIDYSDEEAAEDEEYYNKFLEDNDDYSIHDEADDIIAYKSPNKLFKLKGKSRSRRSYRTSLNSQLKNNFTLNKKIHSAGVIFIEITKIQNLPQLKNKILRKNYDMDPFVIASFGRRVYKTPSKKHSLNPVFNSRISFEVFPRETHFELNFKIMDQDSFSFNDNIAECSLKLEDIIKAQNRKHDWHTHEIPLEMGNILHSKDLNTISEDLSMTKPPKLSVRVKFIPYSDLKKYFWINVVEATSTLQEYDIAQVMTYLDRLGSFSLKKAEHFFDYFGLLAWRGDVLTKEQLIEVLQQMKKRSGFNNIWKCPRCLHSLKPTRNMKNSKITLENDLITHFAICSYSQKYKLLKPSYVSTDFASKRWFSKVLIKLTYGKYALGSNNANILVQDRNSGIILEEKISAHVKLGMRIIYNGKSPETKRFKVLLKKMSIKQGRKFDSPSSIKQIEPFIKFHSLDMSQCQETTYTTFNEFFYRKLKEGARIPEGETANIFVSPADSRSVFFSSIDDSKRIWIKGSKFTLRKLIADYKPNTFKENSSSVAIFRLAPQDYHRFHSPCDGIIGKPLYVDGEYYTVNPMAIRSALDVFGENIRIILPIYSEEFGEVLFIPVGAMMVGSIILSCEEGQKIHRGDELGYFKFGGSTIITILSSQNIIFDSDLLKNSSERIETLVRVGMSVGHTPNSQGFKRRQKKVTNPKEIESIKRSISVNQESSNLVGNVSWQFKNLKKWIETEYPNIGGNSNDEVTESSE
ncbi:hypothetical protein TPHA_0J03110 [Tetrapisispora phaffii CBS 4417]|uniref:Phosphatidylserine decarboxylase proenzyme 2 n=1 Tax=Tetrapisispora phaffii (strain ATCC 24235 / CBS 4417 / NBRC 1672 / NRRL Y-8282 / UCD 70-5) TaxID=1071381 RepID=G8BY80_TETPH|nr:hypothetical protein TPHA_0J03110 [Tetrapisispora phaffii CBS 4417]CCE65131.1 hypothetical protein TPHA_0J03110 [Tetrapisispora phaffii CBS 4417]